jgi:hypothetical protein
MANANNKYASVWRKRALAVIVCTAVALSMIPWTYACADSVKTYTQKKNALQKYDYKKTPFLNNKKGLSKPKPKSYSKSKNYWGKKAFENVANIYKPTKYVGKGYTFKTNLFLSMYLGSKRILTNPQSAALTEGNEYLYVFFNLGKSGRHGRIVRYSYAALIEKGLDTPQGLAKIRIATYNAANNNTTAEDRELLDLIWIGPEFEAGHGQTLSYDYKTKKLWMLLTGSNAYKGILQEISTDTLKPVKRIKFHMETATGNRVNVGKVLTFDKNGYGYFTITVGNSSPKTKRTNIYRIALLKNNKIKIKLMQQIKVAPNPIRLQGLAYNPAENRLVLFAEDAITTIPVNRLGKLRNKDMQYMLYNSRREFEGVCYSWDGHAYLLLNQGPELMRSVD